MKTARAIIYSALLALQPLLTGAEIAGIPLRLDLNHAEGPWFNNKQGYTSLGAFALTPANNKHDFYTFIDARGHVFNNANTAANIGGGIRTITQRNQAIGVNAYYDYMKDNWDHYHHQVGVGFELLDFTIFQPGYDFRINAYFPVGNTTFYSPSYDFPLGRFNFVYGYSRNATSGADIELGKWVHNIAPWSCCHLYTALGTYYISTKHEDEECWGFKARLESRLSECLSIECNYAYDKIYRNSFQVNVSLETVFSLRNPFCDNYCTKEVIYQPVRREEIIISGHKEFDWR